MYLLSRSSFTCSEEYLADDRSFRTAIGKLSPDSSIGNRRLCSGLSWGACTSFEKIEKISPAAAELLRFCAFLHPDAIPEELIINGAAELGPTLQPVATDPISLDATLVILRKFSLVRRNPGKSMLSMHRLVQTVLQDSMSEETQRMWVSEQCEPSI